MIQAKGQKEDCSDSRGRLLWSISIGKGEQDSKNRLD